ncbi:MAG: hypothetical protein JRE73_17220, partial [Deltaproteobacteria bacterium]|nr:hypothetical protein [Deltaproteobacteria bacterium]
MRFVSKVLAPSCLFAVVVSGLCLALPTAGAQEPSTPAEQSPDADTGTDTDTDSDADTDGPEIVLPPGEVAPEEPEAGSYRVEIDPLRGMQQGRMRR